MNLKIKIYLASTAIIVLIGFAFLVISSEKYRQKHRAADALIPRVTATDGTIYKIKSISGCQYLEHLYGTGYMFTHKGDCTNDVHHQ